MIRNASESDILRIIEIRGAVRENRLRDPSRVTTQDLQWFIANAAMFVCELDGRIIGFSAADPRDGSIFALFMDPDYEKCGFGTLLFERACKVLTVAGCRRRWLITSAGTRAEQFYRNAGWKLVGVQDDQLVFEG